VSFVDVFSQKGWQLYGRAVLLKNGDDGFAGRQAILQGMAGDAFKVGMVIDVANRSGARDYCAELSVQGRY
jgi:hypothetical protein